MSDLYDADVLEWSENQARLLRQHAGGGPGNPRKSQSDFAEAPDWANIIEEVESVGRSQLSAVRSLLMRALEHDLKCKAWPQSRDVPHWKIEARRFRIDAAEAFTPSMRQRIDVDELYRKALSLLPEMMDGQPPLAVDPACPVTLDELLQEGR